MLAGVLLPLLGCGTHLFPQPDTAQDYLAYAAFESPDHLGLLLHWPERKMPLKVYLPPPPEGWFADSDAVVETTRRAVTDWTNAAGPGIPSFDFVGKASDADIPIMWVATPPSNSFASIAHCMWQIDFPTRRFGVQNVSITAWNRDGTQVSVDDLHRTLLHEMGHALGIADHSPNPEDIMYPWVRDMKPGSLAEGWVLPSKSKELTDRDRETLRKLYAKPNGTGLAGTRRMY
jgi:matrixin